MPVKCSASLILSEIVPARSVASCMCLLRPKKKRRRMNQKILKRKRAKMMVIRKKRMERRKVSRRRKNKTKQHRRGKERKELRADKLGNRKGEERTRVKKKRRQVNKMAEN